MSPRGGREKKRITHPNESKFHYTLYVRKTRLAFGGRQRLGRQPVCQHAGGLVLGPVGGDDRTGWLGDRRRARRPGDLGRWTVRGEGREHQLGGDRAAFSPPVGL